ncbi:ABC transporter substrate-binding protein [Dolichospermum circinale]|uniref:ABC transporter substrate-binding protein n=1 Tax=Dolichospermum circinale TaxID=109265 RepID=UPI00232BB3CB|nr:ABC transporter substrate-binding protein [Dolichospermum circinale]MDB9448408.1 ABC transporter substrate-binding protein [Dolichospermum circinale CS-547]
MLVGKYTDPKGKIDTETDKKLISNLTGAAKPKIVEVTSIAEVINALDNNKFDILMFAGHSSTLPDGTDTTIWLTDNLTININQISNQIRNALNRRHHPLVLAIFNSCDGIGIEGQLKEQGIRIPYLIAMKARITDEIAHTFLTLFLRYFVRNRMSFQMAYQQAQSGLHPFVPGAESLPILCLRQAKMPDLFWPLGRNRYVPYFGVAIIIVIAIIFPRVMDIIGVSKLESVTCEQVPKLISCYDSSILNLSGSPIDQSIQKKLKTVFAENKNIVDDVKAGKIAEKDVIKIALSLTLNDTSSPIYETAISTLKGAIYLQHEFNKNPNKKLLILIANDPNKWDQAKALDVTTEKLNKELIGRDLDAVVGHYASKLTYYTLKNTFNKKELVLLSYAAAATRDENAQNHSINQLTQKHNKTYFFRVTNTTREMAQLLAKYFQRQGIENIALFYNDTELFSSSFGYEFKQTWTGKFISQDQSNISKMTNEKIQSILKQANNTNNINKTAILLCPNAFIDDPRTSGEIKNTETVMKLNNGQLLIGGCSLIPAYKQESINPNNLVAAVAWSGDINSPNITPEQHKKFVSLKNYWQENLTQEQIRRISLGYDSVMVIAESLSQKGNQSLQQYLINRTTPFKGITGDISFNDGTGNLGSDRIQNVSAIIKPECLSTPCQNWNGQWKTEYNK